MDEELREMAAERICKDYNSSVDDFGERDILLKDKTRINKIEYHEDGFHYYTRYWAIENGKTTPKYREVFPTEEEEYKILDEFYAWY